MSLSTKEQIEDAARFANFCQKMKIMLWDASIKIGVKNGRMIDSAPYELPDERQLDEIALVLYEYLIDKK